MSRRAAAAAAAAAGLALLLAGAGCGRSTPEGGGRSAADPGEGGASVTAELFFPNSSGWLGRESRELAGGGPAVERAERIVRSLLDGPSEPGHLAPLAGAELAGVHMTGGGTLYVDLGSEEHTAPPVSGSRNELLAVYSVVNSILANVPEARRVALLWNGEQRPTFAGHVDTTHPLTADPAWQAR